MANMGRRLGANIRAFMSKANISLEQMADEMGYSIKDVCNMIEGKLIIPPVELDKISSLLGTTRKDLYEHNVEHMVPELQYMKEFSDLDNLDKVLDLMDEYVELKEAM